MWFSPPVKNVQVQGLPLHLDERILGEVSEFKYLGVLLDRDLKFVKHLEAVDNQLSAKLVNFRFNRKFMTMDGAIAIHKHDIVPCI